MIKSIASFIVLILSIGFMFFYVVPAYNLSQTRRGDIASLTKILNTSGEIKTLIEKTKGNLNSIDSSVLSRFEVFLPETIDTLRLANNIQSIALNNRVILSDIKVVGSNDNSVQKVAAPGAVSATQGLINTISLGAKIDQAAGTTSSGDQTTTSVSTGKKYATTKVTLSFVTTYETFQLFLDDLERSLGLINVVSLSFSPVSSASDTKNTKTVSIPTYDYIMEVETYSLQ